MSVGELSNDTSAYDEFEEVGAGELEAALAAFTESLGSEGLFLDLDVDYPSASPECLRLLDPDVQDQQCPETPASEASCPVVDDPFYDPDQD
jgi:hypothetical protein